jgi:AraC family transcriptional regulator
MHPTVVKERRVAAFRLSESVYPAGLKTPRHSHQHACFCLVLNGGSLQTYGSKSRERKPGTMLFYPQDESHSESFGNTDSRVFSVEIDSGWLQRLTDYPITRSESQLFEGGLLSWLALRLYSEFRSSDAVTALAIEGLALEILAEGARQKPEVLTHKTPRWLIQAKDLIHSRFAEHLSLGDIATEVGVHPVYLASAFRRIEGRTVGEYVRKLRVQFAVNELLFSDTPIAQIAVIAGFANQAHLTRRFKQQTGLTPAQYRVGSRHS